MTEYTFKEFQTEYPDDAACLTKLMEINYGGTEIVCPSCGVKARFHMMHERRAFACQECGHHVYPCADTIFHKSSTKLTIWFFAMYLMTSTRHGVAAKEIERQTGVTYKCAWRMCHELRKLTATADDTGPLNGHVEVDETWGGAGATRRQGKRSSWARDGASTAPAFRQGYRTQSQGGRKGHPSHIRSQSRSCRHAGYPVVRLPDEEPHVAPAV